MAVTQVVDFEDQIFEYTHIFGRLMFLARAHPAQQCLEAATEKNCVGQHR